MVVSDTKNSQKIKNKSWLSIEKNITKREKTPCFNYKKLFSFGKILGVFSIG